VTFVDVNIDDPESSNNAPLELVQNAREPVAWLCGVATA
jgi:hypothetical protein